MKQIQICGWLQLSETERCYMEDELERLKDDAARERLLAKVHAAKILYLQTQPTIPLWYKGKAFAN